MAYKGRFNIRNPSKYKGDPQRIIYRSLWERKFMVYCDTNDAILEWGSEEIIIPYLSLGMVVYTVISQISILK